MAGGGQTRPMGGAMPMATSDRQNPINRRGGDHIANLAEGRPAFAPRPQFTPGDGLAGARVPMYSDPRGPTNAQLTAMSSRPQAPSPLAPQGGFNVNQAAAGGLQQAMLGTQPVSYTHLTLPTN